MTNMVFYNSINQVDKEKWVGFYKSHKLGNVYQTFEMFEFWKNLKNYIPFIFLLESDSQECLAFCTGVIVPKGKSKTKNPDKSAIIYGGPLIKDDNNEIFDFFIKKSWKYLKFKSKYIEFRNFGSDLNFKQGFIKNKWKYTPKLNYIIDLTSEEEVFNKFGTSRRKQIRKSLREGVEISYEKSNENIKGVYDILLNIFKTNDKVMALPIPDLEFLSDLLLLKGSGIATVKFNNNIIGGGFFLYDDKIIYNWFRGGLNRDYNKQSPDAVVDWAIMKFGIENNISLFDFGGAGTKGWDNRLRTYKSRFGGELIENGMYSRINFPLLFRIENKLSRILNKTNP